MNTPAHIHTDVSDTEATTEKQKEIQQQQDMKDNYKKKQRSKEEERKDVQTGQDQPAPPLPDQHLEKPGVEGDMELQPRFLAQTYQGSQKLKGMVALITGVQMFMTGFLGELNNNYSGKKTDYLVADQIGFEQ